MSDKEFEVTLPYEGDLKNAIKTAKKYGLEIKNTSQNGIDRVTGITIVIFVGTKNKILNLLEEFGGEENVLETMDAPYGIIT
jgi:hypothetical protein